MPGLVAFGRRWMTATDELVFHFGISVVLRLAWLTLVCIIFGIYAEILNTDPGSPIAEVECKGKVNIYIIGCIILFAIISVMDGLVCYSSSRGTVFDLNKRSAVVPLLYIRAALFVVELIWQILGFVWMFSYQVRHSCHSVPTKRLAQGIVIFNFLFMVAALIMIYIDFDSAGRLWPKLHSATTRESAYGAINREIRAKYEKKWEKSCKALFCCAKVESAEENVFGFVSRLLSEYFQEYLDLVPSDIVAGLILLRRHQKILEARRIDLYLKERQSCSTDDVDDVVVRKGEKFVHRHQKTGSAKAFNYNDVVQSKVFEDVMHFSSYALAVYGWPFYIYDQILCGACTLCCKIRCCATCCGPSKNDFNLIDDNCCECNLAATKLFLNDHDHELIYVSYKDELYQPPFFVAVDHKKKAVVISCRGTLSLKDVLTDVMVEEAKIPFDNGEPNLMGHKGMIQSAQFVLDVIEKEELLEKAFNCDTERGSQSYSLKIVGHSLGAGVASILAFLLRPKYPDLVCFAYSAVGATFNFAASKYAKDFIYSIVVGKDVISRLNLHTLDELRYMIIELLQRSALPKWKILRGCLCQCMLCCQSSSRNSHEDYLDYELYDIPPYIPESSKRYYMGGRVIHIVKTHSIYPKWFGKKKAVYEAVWADVEDFQSILISNLMWKDHVPDTVKEALHSCWEEVQTPRENGSAIEVNKAKENSHTISKSPKSDEEVGLLSEPIEEEPPVWKEEDVKVAAADVTEVTTLEDDLHQTEEDSGVCENIPKQEESDSTLIIIDEDVKPCEEVPTEDVQHETGAGTEEKPAEVVLNPASSMGFVEIAVEDVHQESHCESRVEKDQKPEVEEEQEKPAETAVEVCDDEEPVEIVIEDAVESGPEKPEITVEVSEVKGDEEPVEILIEDAVESRPEKQEVTVEVSEVKGDEEPVEIVIEEAVESGPEKQEVTVEVSEVKGDEEPVEIVIEEAVESGPEKQEVTVEVSKVKVDEELSEKEVKTNAPEMIDIKTEVISFITEVSSAEQEVSTSTTEVEEVKLNKHPSVTIEIQETKDEGMASEELKKDTHVEETTSEVTTQVEVVVPPAVNVGIETNEVSATQEKASQISSEVPEDSKDTVETSAPAEVVMESKVTDEELKVIDEAKVEEQKVLDESKVNVTDNSSTPEVKTEELPIIDSQEQEQEEPADTVVLDSTTDVAEMTYEAADESDFVIVEEDSIELVTGSSMGKLTDATNVTITIETPKIVVETEEIVIKGGEIETTKE